MAVRIVAAIAPVAVLVWLATRRPRLRTSDRRFATVATSLFARPACRLEGIRVTHVVELDDDLIVGYRDGAGTWLAGEAQVIGAWRADEQGQLLLAGAVRDGRAMTLLHRWQSEQTRLTSAVSADGAFVGIVDWRSRWAIVAGHRPA